MSLIAGTKAFFDHAGAIRFPDKRASLRPENTDAPAKIQSEGEKGMKKYRVEMSEWVNGSGFSYKTTIDNIDDKMTAEEYFQTRFYPFLAAWRNKRIAGFRQYYQKKK